MKAIHNPESSKEG